MREFTCIVCGAKGINRSYRQDKKFCSTKCSNAYWNKKRYGGNKGYPPCKYNEGVACTDKDCKSCGWHPDVIKKRKEAIV